MDELNKSTAVVFSVDIIYAQHLFNVIYSFHKYNDLNLKNICIIFCYLESQELNTFEKSYKNNLIKLLKSLNYSVEFYYISLDLFQNLLNIPDLNKTLSIKYNYVVKNNPLNISGFFSAVSKLIIPYILNRNRYENIFYVDIDIFFKKPISEFFNYFIPKKTSLVICDDNCFFKLKQHQVNTGFFILNIPFYLEYFTLEKIKNKLLDPSPLLFLFLEQIVFCDLLFMEKDIEEFRKNTVILPFYYNYQTHYIFLDYVYHLEEWDFKKFPNFLLKTVLTVMQSDENEAKFLKMKGLSFYQQYEKRLIRHYSSWPKPWSIELFHPEYQANYTLFQKVIYGN